MIPTSHVAKRLMEGVTCDPERVRINRGGECEARNVPLDAISMLSGRRQLRPFRHSGPPFVIPAQAGIQRGGWAGVPDTVCIERLTCMTT